MAVAARSPAKAYEFASMHSIPTYHNSYQELISNPNIDIIYIATIADHHYELAKQSILAGKHTLVEKPMTLCYNHTQELIELATKQSTENDKNVFLMEGMWTRCFPAMHKLRQLVLSEEVGQIVYVQGDFGYEFPNNGYSPTTNNDRIWYPNSGGITLDVGMYIAQLGRIAFPNGKVKDVQAVGTMKNGVDFTVMANVTYDRPSLQYCKNTGYNSGSDDRCNNTTSSNSSRDSSRDHLLTSEEDTVGMLQMVLTGASNTEERCVLQGTKGRIILDGPFHVPQRLRVVYNDGRRRGEYDNNSSSSTSGGVSSSNCDGGSRHDSNSDEVVYDFPLPDDPFHGKWNNPGSIGLVYQINEVGNALRMGKTECDSFTWQDSLDVAQIMDEIVRQVRVTGQ